MISEGHNAQKFSMYSRALSPWKTKISYKVDLAYEKSAISFSLPQKKKKKVYRIFLTSWQPNTNKPLMTTFLFNVSSQT